MSMTKLATTLATTLATMLASLLALANGHSFLTVPMPISTVETCRVGGNPGWLAFCGGPCPDFNFRYDMRPEHPAAEWQRGSEQTIHYSKNNHDGGFVRLSLVPLDERMRREAHDALAFHYGCWSEGEFSCKRTEQHRDCGFDRDNLAYRVSVVVPTTHPDGVYVLGWAWYGGGTVTSDFGDYYDCAFVHIRGGPLTDTFSATFRGNAAVRTPSNVPGCVAAVDRLGVCRTEPCFEHDGKKFDAAARVPVQFSTRDSAPIVYREWLEHALRRDSNRVRAAAAASAWDGPFGVWGVAVYDTGNEKRVEMGDVSDATGRAALVDVSGRGGVTLAVDTFGHVERVEWVINGRLEATRTTAPFAIGGQETRGDGGTNFYDWPFPVEGQRVFVTAIAHSNASARYFSTDLHFERRWR
ncbi:unnamed protein product [Agarophyton chilense]